MSASILRRLQSRIERRRDDKALEEVGNRLSGALEDATGVPVIVISYNNGVYVENMIRQLCARGVSAIIIDNASTDAASVSTLDKISKSGQATVIRSRRNLGHMVGFRYQVYEKLPNIFAYTDPDLQFHPDMPADFLPILEQLTWDFKAYKAGLALPLEHAGHRATTKNPFVRRYLADPERRQDSYTVTEWESAYWKMRVTHPDLEIFSAPIDTTFAVYNKKNFRGDHLNPSIRVAGDFSALHLPWFKEIDPMTHSERQRYLKDNKSSTWAK